MFRPVLRSSVRWIRNILALVICVSCLDPYSPPIAQEQFDLLVVDGYIDSDGSAYVKLSRTLPLYSIRRTPLESGASVSITSSAGQTFNLTEIDSAVYTASNLNVNNTDTYSLHVTTKAGRKYESNSVIIHPTPDVDSVYVRLMSGGTSIDIVTDSYDTNPDATGYYMIDCIETWLYNVPMQSLWKIVGDDVASRTEEDMITDCWKTLPTPTTIYNAHSLSTNMIKGHRVSNIQKGSQKISRRYSALIRQRSISREEYEFREQLKETTEELGNLFAVIPGAVVGNVHSVDNSKESVLGYFRGQEIKEKRMFVSLIELPISMWGGAVPTCPIEYTCPKGFPRGDCFEIKELGNSVVVVRIAPPGGATVQVGFVPIECADCRALGGTTIKPLFWQ